MHHATRALKVDQDNAKAALLPQPVEPPSHGEHSPVAGLLPAWFGSRGAGQDSGRAGKAGKPEGKQDFTNARPGCSERPAACCQVKRQRTDAVLHQVRQCCLAG